ncbi:helix-turn-helix transcriptional regulator [Corynebacterium sp. H128]|uniref:helix-turn-helix domain-containing protein n=1 Tax=unclassified Corynebacterium TaxID=2624378 RepID=UPI0030B63915
MHDDKNLLKEFGERLRQARENVGISQETLAHRAGLHRTYVGSVERGERNLSLLNILSLATVLHIDASQLVQGMKRESM